MCACWEAMPKASALVIDNGLACLEARDAVLQGVLAAARASPLAPLFSVHASVQGVDCTSLNYSQRMKGVDACFSPATLHYRPDSLPPFPGVPRTDEIDLFQAKSERDGLLTTYDHLHDLPNGTAALQSECSCFTGSTVCNRLAPGACAGVAAANCNRTADSDAKADAPIDTTTPVEPRAQAPAPAPLTVLGSHVPDAGLLCNEGPVAFMSNVMVARLKNGSLGALHQNDGVQPNVTCAARGFVTRLNPTVPDHCYPPATLWHRAGDVFNLYRMEWLENGAFLAYDAATGTRGAGYKVAVCDCLPGSAVRRGLPPQFCAEPAREVEAVDESALAPSNLPPAQAQALFSHPMVPRRGSWLKSWTQTINLKSRRT